MNIVESSVNRLDNSMNIVESSVNRLDNSMNKVESSISVFNINIIDDNSWNQLGSNIIGLNGGEDIGNSVAISNDGTIVAFGSSYKNATGAVRIYEYDSSWVQLGSDITGIQYSQSSSTVSLSSDGTIVAIGERHYIENYGRVRIYEYNDISWVQLGGEIIGTSTNSHFGTSVSLSADGKIVAIGGIVPNTGIVGIYRYNDISWVQLGDDIIGNGDSQSGYSVSLSSNGEIVAIGGYLYENNCGIVEIYQYNDGSWVQLGSDISGNSNDQTGHSVSLSNQGTIVAIGSPTNGIDSGYVSIYEYNGSSWAQLGSNIIGETSGDQSGRSISLSDNGKILAIGAPYNDGNQTNSGHVRVYEYKDSSWVKLGNDIDGLNSANFSGRTVSLSSHGDIVAIGGAYNSVGIVQVYNLNRSSIIVDINMSLNGRVTVSDPIYDTDVVNKKYVDDLYAELLALINA